MTDFKVGDRVRRCLYMSSGVPVGVVGTVKAIYQGYGADMTRVDFGKYGTHLHLSDRLELVSKGESMDNPSKARFGVNWMEDEDPTEFFATEEQAKKRIEELLKDENVQKDSIYFFEIKDVHKVEVPTAYKLVRLAKRLVGRPRKTAK